MKQVLLVCVILALVVSCISCLHMPKEQKVGVDEIIMNMSLEDKVGQLFIFGIDISEMDGTTAGFLQNTKAGNIILFSKNISDLDQLVALNTSLQNEIIKNTNIPALIGIDQEGGLVTRIREGATFFPGAMAFSAAGNPDATYTQGQYMGQELRELGIHINFAPVADMNSNPNNPVIGVRSYGDSADMVSAYTKGIIAGLQEQRVIACVKHFPGHGDTIEDSHLSLPTVNKTLEELRESEIKAFQNAVNNGVDAVMTAHILFPQIETENIPASLSKTFLSEILRDQMGFNGLIITDSLKMNAIKSNYDIGEAAIMAVNAGANMLITGSGEIDNNDITMQINAYYAVLAAVKNGTITHDTLYKSVRRILEYKERYGLLQNPYPIKSIDTTAWADHKSFAEQISLNSITLLQNRRNLLPLSNETLVISNTTDIPLDKTQIDADSKNSFAFLLAKRIGGDYMTMSQSPDQEHIQLYVNKAREYKNVVIAINSANQSEAVSRVIRANPNTVVVSLGSPYRLDTFGAAGALLCAYEYTPNSVKSLIKVLTGEAEAVGNLPVKLN